MGRAHIRYGQDDHEFFSTVSTDDVLGADAAGKKSSRLAQDGVAGIVTIGVVESFEVVEIEHENPQPVLGANGAARLAFHHLFEVAAVVETSQRIANRLVTKCFAEAEIGDRKSDLVGKGTGDGLF